jgi:hypothetical protein
VAFTFAGLVGAFVVMLAAVVIRLDERLLAPSHREHLDRPHPSERGVDWASLNLSTRVGYLLVDGGTPKAHHYDHQPHTRERAERWPRPVPARIGRHRRPEPSAPRTKPSSFTHPAWYTGTTIPLWITAGSEA